MQATDTPADRAVARPRFAIPEWDMRYYSMRWSGRSSYEWNMSEHCARSLTQNCCERRTEIKLFNHLIVQANLFAHHLPPILLVRNRRSPRLVRQFICPKHCLAINHMHHDKEHQSTPNRALLNRCSERAAVVTRWRALKPCERIRGSLFSRIRTCGPRGYDSHF